MTLFTSAGLALRIGPKKANKMGMEKELSDSRGGGSGFSFVNIAEITDPEKSNARWRSAKSDNCG